MTYLGRRAGSPRRNRLLQTTFVLTVMYQCCSALHRTCEGKRVWIERENRQLLTSDKTVWTANPVSGRSEATVAEPEGLGGRRSFEKRLYAL